MRNSLWKKIFHQLATQKLLISQFKHVLLWIWRAHVWSLGALHCGGTYLCSVGSKLWLFGLEPPSIDNWAGCAVFSIPSSEPFMLCSSLSCAICSCCSFNSFLCCVMICCWTAYLFSNLLPGNAGRFGPVKPLPSTLCRASWSSAAVGAACRRVTCHGCVGWATAPTGVLFWGIAEALGAKVRDLWWSSCRIILYMKKYCP